MVVAVRTARLAPRAGVGRRAGATAASSQAPRRNRNVLAVVARTLGRSAGRIAAVVRCAVTAIPSAVRCVTAARASIDQVADDRAMSVAEARRTRRSAARWVVGAVHTARLAPRAAVRQGACAGAAVALVARRSHDVAAVAGHTGRNTGWVVYVASSAAVACTSTKPCVTDTRASVDQVADDRAVFSAERTGARRPDTIRVPDVVVCAAVAIPHGTGIAFEARAAASPNIIVFVVPMEVTVRDRRAHNPPRPRANALDEH